MRKLTSHPPVSDVNSSKTTFGKLFQKVKDIHNLNTRHATSGKLFKPNFRTNDGKCFITNTGVDIWNSIPQNIRPSASKTSFSRAFVGLRDRNWPGL